MERGLGGGVTHGLSRTVSHVVWSVEGGGRLRKHGRSRRVQVLFDARRVLAASLVISLVTIESAQFVLFPQPV